MSDAELINMEDEYTYRNGEHARIVCIDSGSDSLPVISVDDDGNVFSHTNDGHISVYKTEDKLDLIKKPKVVKGWVNIYKSGKVFYTGSSILGTKEEAEESICPSEEYVATTYMECEY